jgi:hypothetical protein
MSLNAYRLPEHLRKLHIAGYDRSEAEKNLKNAKTRLERQKQGFDWIRENCQSKWGRGPNEDIIAKNLAKLSEAVETAKAILVIAQSEYEVAKSELSAHLARLRANA